MLNSVQVRIHRDDERNGPIPTFFARIFGIDSTGLSARATATFKDGCVGFRLTSRSANASLLPFALKVTTWQSFLAGHAGVGDHYVYDQATGAVTPAVGSAIGDGVNELNLYPGAGASQLTPGNFGTVDIGPSNNSTNDIKRQILSGVSYEDLNREPFWGEVKLGDDGTLLLNGDTGLSAGFKAELEAIKGKPRTIVLFSELTGGNGNNTNYVIVGFAGIRIVNVKLTGSMNSKEVLIQPAFVIDEDMVAGYGPANSYFVYQPVRITR
jgi:hypothetical protein